MSIHHPVDWWDVWRTLQYVGGTVCWINIQLGSKVYDVIFQPIISTCQQTRQTFLYMPSSRSYASNIRRLRIDLQGYRSSDLIMVRELSTTIRARFGRSPSRFSPSSLFHSLVSSIFGPLPDFLSSATIRLHNLAAWHVLKPSWTSGTLWLQRIHDFFPCPSKLSMCAVRLPSGIYVRRDITHHKAPEVNHLRARALTGKDEVPSRGRCAGNIVKFGCLRSGAFLRLLGQTVQQFGARTVELSVGRLA